MKLGLGIDTGGTYTDAVLFDFTSNEIVSKAKSRTTHYDLTRGIAGAIDRLEKKYFDRIRLVVLSTTLATNAIVEGKGGRTALVLMGYDLEIFSRYGFREELPFTEYFHVHGRHDLKGYPVNKLDVNKVKEIAQTIKGKYNAVAISEYLGIRNPEYELIAKDIVTSITSLPVVCGHELTVDINSIKRAATCGLNARLIPLINNLLLSVKKVLNNNLIKAPIMIVKGDGSLMSEKEAIKRPIETVLSGPASSVVGASYLSGIKDGVVVDMGGTTTDIATLTDGRPVVSKKGARVGNWLTSVKAVDIRTFGLGGDSSIAITGEGVKIGPKRVIPLSVAGNDNKVIEKSLEKILEKDNWSLLYQVTDFIVKKRDDNNGLTSKEKMILSSLNNTPFTLEETANKCNIAYPSLIDTERLEQMGCVERIGLTPTDVLHALGIYTSNNRRSAMLGCEIASSQRGMELEEFLNDILSKIKVSLISEIVGQCMYDKVKGGSIDNDGLFSYFIELATNEQVKNDYIGMELFMKKPIVAMGAPVESYFPQLEKELNTEVIIPNHTEVANAIGAVTGGIMNKVEAVVKPNHTPAGIQEYVLHLPESRYTFEKLEEAKDFAISNLKGLVRKKAQEEGTDSDDVKIQVDKKTGTTSAGWGGDILLEVIITATIWGRPGF